MHLLCNCLGCAGLLGSINKQLGFLCEEGHDLSGYRSTGSDMVRIKRYVCHTSGRIYVYYVQRFHLSLDVIVLQ